MKVMLQNDTASVPHIGCQAFSDAHARMVGATGHIISTRYFFGELKRLANADEDAAIQSVLREKPLRAEIEACDVVVVNSECTFNHGVSTEYFSLPRPRRPRHVPGQARKQEPRHRRTLTPQRLAVTLMRAAGVSICQPQDSVYCGQAKGAIRVDFPKRLGSASGDATDPHRIVLPARVPGCTSVAGIEARLTELVRIGNQ